MRITEDEVIVYSPAVAEVARQVDSAVRYAVRQALGREIERLTIHVDGLRVAPFELVDDRLAGSLGSSPTPAVVRPDDLAGSGTDVA